MLGMLIGEVNMNYHQQREKALEMYEKDYRESVKLNKIVIVMTVILALMAAAILFYIFRDSNETFKAGFNLCLNGGYRK